MKLNRRADALIALDEIWVCSLNNRSGPAARRHVEALPSKAEAPADGQMPGQAAPDIQAGQRRLVVGSHVIWFRYVGESLEIIRFLHQSRDVGR